MFGKSKSIPKNNERRFEDEDWGISRTDTSVRSIFTSGSSFRRLPPSRHIPEPPEFQDSPRPPRQQKSSADRPDEEEPLPKLLDFQSEESKPELPKQEQHPIQDQHPKQDYDEFMSAIDCHLQHIPVPCSSPTNLSDIETPIKRGDRNDSNPDVMLQEKDDHDSNGYTMVFEGVGKWELPDEGGSIPSRSYSEGLVPSGTPRTWDDTSVGSESGFSGIATEMRDEYTIGSLTREIRIEEDDPSLLSEVGTFLPVEEELKKKKQKKTSYWCEAIYCGSVLMLICGIAVGVAAMVGAFSSSSSSQAKSEREASPMSPNISPTKTPMVPGASTSSMPTEGPALVTTTAPSQSPEKFPSLPPSPQLTEVVISVVIQTDEYAGDTGWSLVCDGRTLAEVKQSTYSKDVDKIVETFIVSDGASCTFVISDNYGDGLCCEYGIGFYRIYHGEDISENGELIVGGSQFGYNETQTFVASSGMASLTPAPSISRSPLSSYPSQSIYPSQAPSRSPETAAPTESSLLNVMFQFDQYPLETGWTLQCDGEIIADVPSNTYKIPRSSTSQSFHVATGSKCQLVVTDSSAEGDGICCNYGNGYYQVYYIDEDKGSSLVAHGASFRYKAVTDFIAAAPPPTDVFITVTIQMDLFADEIYWDLECDGETLVDVPAGSYMESSFVLFAGTFTVPQGSQCRLRLRDSYGDGLCCSSGAGVGNYRVYYGPDITDDNMIIIQGSEFKFEEENVFEAASPRL